MDNFNPVFLMEELERLRIKDIIVPKLSIIEQEIDKLFFVKIKNCVDEIEAGQYFDLLQKIQEILATLFFRDLITVSDKLEKFIKDCDRLDDPWLRSVIYNMVKQDLYNYNALGF